MQARRFSLFLLAAYSSSVSPECASSWEAMVADPNFQHWNSSVNTQCYVTFQNRVLESTEKVKCSSWEYDSFCTDVIGGRACRMVTTADVEIPICVPAECSENEVMTPFSIDCSPVPNAQTPVIAAVLSTILVLIFTGGAVFFLRPPREIRESVRLNKSQKNLLSLSGTETNSLS